MTTSQIISLVLVAALIATVVGLLYYLYRLRGDFYEACRESGNLELYASCPLGIPVGSVRSTLALLIVLFAIGYMGVTGVEEPPQFITAVVSTVIGFYFGSRSSSGGGENRGAVQDLMSGASPSTQEAPDSTDARNGTSPASTATPAESAPTPADTDAAPARRQEAQDLLARLEEGLSVTEVARSVLPRSLRKRFSSLTQALQNGVETVEGLVEADSVGDALEKGRTLLQRFRKDNPVRTILERALGSFAPVLGAAVKPLPLIGSIVNVAQSVKTEVYDRWKARILHTSFEPADLPIERVDANTGFTLLSTTPIMKEAFREELEANDRSFLEDTAEELLSTGELESLWSTYSDRFDSRQQFEEGVAALRRAAADLELREELDPALFEEVGGYEKAVANIDKLHADDAAQGDLDAIVTMFEALQNADGVGTSIRQLFEDVRADLTSSEASPTPS
ncbi:MAG: hypothetical protein V5A22_04275 [Salinivenus sp.]